MREEPDLIVVQSQRVGVELLGLRSTRPKSLCGVPEVGEGLALDLPLVPPEAPVAKMEGLVRENQRAESLLPCRNVGTTHTQRTRADNRAEDGVVHSDIGVRPPKRRCPVRLPLGARRAANLSYPQ
jgi:hypothetical protein